jgi:hypothetical protein
VERGKREIFVLRLAPLPGIDAIKNLRWVLKKLLRQHGFRCVSIKTESVEEENENDEQTETGN